MKLISSTEAKAKLSALLSDVERGETIFITRHGKIIARISPEKEEDAKMHRSAEAVRRFQQRRKTLPPTDMSVEDILSARDEGRK